ncbi:amino acid adenylation domain-containing protein [Niallia sp. Krafla_26]|uniref:amino acid adenylation domain-containing protein n=1 Tax=Niallia sp. Krafla_26 TaxID=3064703 RepID=UPI003D181ACB
MSDLERINNLTNISHSNQAVKSRQKENDLDFAKREPDYTKNTDLYSLFREQKNQFPDKNALVYHEESWTYEQLDWKAQKLAQTLVEQGITKNDVVAILVGHKVEQIVSILSIVKIGAIYLPIDPEYPVDRIEFMVEHAKAKAIIIDQDEEHVKYHATIPSIHCLRVEKNTYTLSDMKDDYSITKESPAYIMYTSGTTGKPKGILIRQKGIIRLVKNPNYIKILTTDRFLQTSTFVFDASTFEIWGALLNGATLYLSDKEEILDPVLLKERIHKNQITTMWMTAPLFNQLIELDPTLFRTLHYLIVGGDTLSEKHIQRLFDYHSNLKVINGYGPTENTTFSITYEISSPPKGIIPIGKPINNTEVYILDEEKRPVAPGEEGEICLGGDGLAVGYINNVSLTNEKFIDHPFKVGEKLYCTGDWGRVRGDGNIEFLERKDRQFKINGYRVELKEIETIAKKNEAITDAVITVKEEGNKKHLTLYYISESLDRKQMLDYLNYVLPRYMVPSQIIQLNQFPLNDRGKIDMQKLREKTEILDTLTERVDQDAFKNGSRLENEIIDMVSRVGNQSEKISMESNLFEMGFDSLKIALLINEINKKYQKQISLREIFSHPTVKKIVELIGYKRSERLEQIVKKPTTKTKYPASSAQKRVFLASKFSEVGTNYNIPLILKLEGELNKSFLLEAINKVLDRHEALRTNFLYQDKQIYQIIHENVTLEMKERIGEESKIEQLIKENLTQFDLEKDILVNVTLICVRDHVHYLLMDMHHIVIDGYSVNLLINELFSLYEGKAIHDVEYQYKDISELQQKYLKSDNFKKHESYWLQYLTQQKESRWLSSYPIQKKANHEPIGKEIEWVLDGNIVKQMKEYLRKNEYTEMMFLFTCFYVSIMKLTSNNEQRIGVPFSGRNRMEYKDVIGMLVNVMPVYLNVEENNTFEDLLQQTKNVLLDAIENQNYPFEMLVEKLNNGRKANENPLFDITFDVQHDDSSGFYIQNNQMEVKPCTIDFSISKFSISMAALISEGQIRFKLQYRMNEWMENQVNKIKYTLNKFIEMGLTNPSTPIKEWFSITTKGLDIQMEEINRTSVDYPKEKNLYYLFQEQMNHNSQKKILVYHSKSWTYEQLDWKVRQLSQALIEQGASKHDVIGILIGNKVEQIVSMLAIVKIGAIYLPIDPNYPEERIHYILEDAKAKFLIIDEEIEHLKDSQDMVIVNCNDSREFEINELSDTSDESITGETPAYIMYTSGTTGKPKGILIRQKGIIRLVKNTNYIDILPTDRLLQTSTFVFDASTFEIWGALLNGAALYLSDKKEILDSAVLREKISVNQITIMWLTAPLFNQLVKQDPTLFNH